MPFRRTSLLLQPWAAEPARRRLTVTESAALGPTTEPGCRLGFRISWPLAAGPPSRPGPAAVVIDSDYGARPGHTVAASRVNLAILAAGRTQNHSRLTEWQASVSRSVTRRMTEPRSHRGAGAPRPGRRATDSKVQQS